MSRQSRARHRARARSRSSPDQRRDPGEIDPPPSSRCGRARAPAVLWTGRGSSRSPPAPASSRLHAAARTSADYRTARTPHLRGRVNRSSRVCWTRCRARASVRAPARLAQTTAWRRTAPHKEAWHGRRDHETAARKRRPLRAPDPSLEPQDEALHLHRAQRHLHHRPAAVAVYIDRAYEFVKDTVARGGTVLFVGTSAKAKSRSPSRRPGWGCPTSTSVGSAAC
jgi:hypothetical protein